MLGGMQRTLSGLIMSLAHNYLVKIDPNLNLSLWGGDVVLRGVEFRIDVLQSIFGHDHGIRFDHASIAELRINIPWTAITTSSVKITLSGVNFVATLDPLLRKPEPSTDSGTSPLQPPELFPEESVADDEKSFIDKDAASGSWTKSLLARIIANVALSVVDLEFILLGPDCARACLRVDSLSVQSTDSSWNVVQVDPPSPPWKLSHYLITMSHIIFGVDLDSSPTISFDEAVIRDLDIEVRCRVFQSPSTRFVHRTSITLPICDAGPKAHVEISAFSPCEIIISPTHLKLFTLLIPPTPTRVVIATPSSSSLASPNAESIVAVFPDISTLSTPTHQPTTVSRNSWGSWAWDILAGPVPDDSNFVDIGSSAPSGTVVFTFHVPTLTLQLSNNSHIFAAFSFRGLAVAVSHALLQQQLALHIRSITLVNQATLLPTMVVSSDADSVEYMPFIGDLIDTSDQWKSYMVAVEQSGLTCQYQNIDSYALDGDVGISYRLTKSVDNIRSCLYINSAVFLANLKASSSATFLTELSKFSIVLDREEKALEGMATAKPIIDSCDVFIGRLFTCVKLDDASEWKRDDFHSDMNAVSIQLMNLSLRYGLQATSTLSCSGVCGKAHQLVLERHRYIDSATDLIIASVDDIDVSVSAHDFSTFSIAVDSIMAAFSLQFLYILTLIFAASAGACEVFLPPILLRSALINMRPTRSIMSYDAMLSNSTLSFCIRRLDLSGTSPSTISASIYQLSCSIARKGQKRDLITTSRTPCLNFSFTTSQHVMVEASELKITWDAIFFDMLYIVTIYSNMIVAPLSNRVESSGNRFQIKRINVKISPIVICVPLQDVFHIRRLPELFGYRSSPTIYFHLPAIALDPLSLSMTGLAIIDHNDLTILEPFNAQATLSSDLARADVDIGRIVFNIDIRQSTALKLALAALIPPFSPPTPTS